MLCLLAGDLLTALLLAKLHQQPDNMQHAVEHAIASLQGVLLATVDAAGEAAHVKERTSEVAWQIYIVHASTVISNFALATDKKHAYLAVIGSPWQLTLVIISLRAGYSLKYQVCSVLHTLLSL